MGNLNQVRINNLKLLISKYKNLLAFSRQHGIDYARLHMCLNGKRNASEKLVRDVERKLNLELGVLDKHQALEIKPVKMVLVKQYAVKACAGDGMEILLEDEIEPVSIPIKVLQQRGLKPQDVFAVEVIGSSMMPTYNEEDYIFVNKNHGKILNYKAYLIKYDYKLMIKRLEKVGSVITLKADNPNKNEYPDIIVREDIPFEILGHIFYKMGE